MSMLLGVGAHTYILGSKVWHNNISLGTMTSMDGLASLASDRCHGRV